MWGILALGVRRSGVYVNVERQDVGDPRPRRSSIGGIHERGGIGGAGSLPSAFIDRGADVGPAGPGVVGLGVRSSYAGSAAREGSQRAPRLLPEPQNSTSRGPPARVLPRRG